jgi:hypothetical protein
MLTMYRAFYHLHTDPFPLGPDPACGFVNEPLSYDDTRAYVQERMRSAGWSGDPLFDECSYRMVYHFSGGLVREIHAVCDQLLQHGSSGKKHRLTCFDTLQVVRRLLEEQAGTTCEDRFQACVDLLNRAWPGPESGVAHAASAASSAPAVPQDKPSSRTGPQPAPPPPPSSPFAAGPERYAGLAKAAQAASDHASPAPQTSAADSQTEATGEADISNDAPERGEEPVPSAGSDTASGSARPAAADRAGHGASEQARVTPVARPQGRYKRTAVRAGTVLVLCAALVGVSLHLYRDHTARVPAQQGLSVAAGEEAARPPLSSSPPQVPPPRAVPDGEAAQSKVRSNTPVQDQPGVEPELDDAEPNEPMAPGNRSGGAEASKAVAKAPSPVAGTRTAVQDADIEPVAPGPGWAAATEHPAMGDGPATDVTAEAAPDALKADTVPGVVANRDMHQADAQQERIERLMRDAERALTEDRLTVPRDNSAYKYYREVLEVAPQHAEARLGMERIADRYIALIEHAVATDRLDRAARYAARGLRVSPGNRELLSLQREVQARSLRRALQGGRAVGQGRDDTP